MQLDASPVPLAEDDPIVPGSIVGLGLFCAKDLQREDRVAFDDGARDSYGMPAMRIHYRLTERDHEVLDRAKQEIVRLGKAVGEPLDERPFVLPPGASLHYQGTTRMGAADDGESVCSPDSQVWAGPRPLRGRQRCYPHRHRMQPHADGSRARRARGTQDHERTQQLFTYVRIRQ